jgi:hypothetical protein
MAFVGIPWNLLEFIGIPINLNKFQEIPIKFNGMCWNLWPLPTHWKSAAAQSANNFHLTVGDLGSPPGGAVPRRREAHGRIQRGDLEFEEKITPP